MLPLESGDPVTIGPYRLLGVLGAGGMGRVYLGRNAGGRTVAVKVVRPDLSDDPEFRTRFRREVAAARRVTGAHAVPVLDADVEAERPWLATGYVAGLSLREAVDSFGPLPESALVPLAAGLARALADVHAAGVVHRDLKPSNVLLTLDGPRLIDFGIARAADDGTLTTTGTVIGSPGYMAPEHISGDAPVGPAVDVFALGGVLVYAASGSGPFGSGDSIPMLWRVMQEPARLDGLPAALRPIAGACLDKQPGNRPTPADVERQCVALGDAWSGWLPGPILEAISRQAVMLLDLDSGPVPHDPPVTPHSAPELPSTLIASAGRTGATGHPNTPVPPIEASPPTVRRSDPGDAGRSSTITPGHSLNTGIPGQTGPWPGTPTQQLAPWTPRGHTPAGAHTENTPAQRNSSRRRLVVIGCLAVLLVAAAVISATLAFRSASSDRPASAAGTETPVETAGSEETSAPEATAAETTAAGSELPALPAEYVGTWKGTATDGLATYDIAVTLRAGAVGTELGTASNTGRTSGLTCRRAETLTSASDSAITLRARLVSGATCVDDGQSSTLTLNPDHTVAYSMTGPIGAITGTLRRQ
ncbi:serine/threonine protein kinase [Nocardia nova]|uniref:Serine/threonine protein kinase n=1 Tax=Nocardia nova TaxID=37330 RepID=A0A2S6AKX2_9NOCA|nr:serine/threonine-protein kinase [Nocardia nova]PPJ22348.1 serine/threonine protein kinase [Nocardia nova]PPJ35870.1 serine/threonine protein kinase [Nocardia nova]